VQIDLPSEAVPTALAERAGQVVVTGPRPEGVSRATSGMVAGPMQHCVDARVCFDAKTETLIA